MIKKNLFLTLFLFSFVIAPSQDNENKTQTFYLNGNMTLTTKGLSTFPNLTLGKPAAIFDLSAGGERFRFDPVFRFGLDGKPWTFIFWLRYEAVKNEKFGLRFGAHPAYSFKTIGVTHNGIPKELLRTHQFLAMEIAPVFKLSKNIRLGPYYIYSYGVDSEAVRNSNFISLQTFFSNLNLSENYYTNLAAQVYYLKMDDKAGVYVYSALSLNRRNFPFLVSSTVNAAINSTLPGKSILWNINLTYRFTNLFYR